MGRTNTKKMVQGAMIAAIFGALSLFNTYTGSMFDVLICYVMSVPLVWYGYTYSLKDNIIVCVVSMFVIAMMGLPFFVISSIESCLAGLFIGEALKRKAKKETILFGTLAVTFLNNILIYEVFSGLLGVDLIAEMRDMYITMIQPISALSNRISLEFFIALAPLFLLMVSVIEMYVIVLMCQIILMRLNIQFPGSFHIANMHLSKPVGLILSIGLVVSYGLVKFGYVDSIYLTYLYTICVVVLALQGLAFLSWLLIVKEKAKFMIFVLLGLFIPMVNTFYVVIGIVDIFSDLRENILYNRHSND
ncbi:DUF2232 domain-containing protein [Longibaculum muris]|uniref:DUF2232 domain-containing protein n=1 Tax=Longibaculum muris TaxID=1796628 RepID=UPI00189D35AC|nr:DUF2232 domain-containing protein [Longibaculum muris]